jgi:hypothetical protein
VTIDLDRLSLTKESEMLRVACFAASAMALPLVVGAVPVELGAGSQPRVVSGGGRRVAVVFARAGEILIADSADAGKAFGEARTIARIDGLMLGMRRGPRAVVTNDTMVVTAIAAEKGNVASGDVWAWSSTDGAKTWSKSTRPINSVPGSAREGLHGMASGPGGMVACVWLDMRNTPKDRHGTEVWMTLSNDGGATWQEDRLVYRNAGGTVCECCHPSVTIDADKGIHVMFRNAKEGARDMYLTSSRDGGRTFTDSQKLGRGTWPLNACPMDGGSATFDAKGNVKTVWMRAGSVFTTTAGADEQRLGNGRQPVLVALPSGSWTGWIDGTSLMARWPNGPTQKLADQANFPTASPGSDGSVVIAWQQNNDVFVDVITAPHSQP